MSELTRGTVRVRSLQPADLCAATGTWQSASLHCSPGLAQAHCLAMRFSGQNAVARGRPWR